MTFARMLKAFAEVKNIFANVANGGSERLWAFAGVHNSFACGEKFAFFRLEKTAASIMAIY